MARRVAEVVPMLLMAMWLSDTQALANSIVSTSPAQNEKAAPRGLNVAATCDSTIDGATVTQSTFRVQGDRTGRISGTYSASGATFQLNPASDFKPGELVRVTATSGIESTSDVALTPRVWQFTAAAGRAAGAMKAHGSFGTGSSVSVALGDLDGDGDLDAVVGNYANQAETVWLNDGSGSFTTAGSFGGDQTFDVELGDLDGDDDLDAVAANEGQPATVWLNNGSASFSGGATFGVDARDVALGDIDSDGDLDAVCAGSETIFVNDGTGAFTAHPGTPFFGPGDGYGYGVDLGDLDSDGDLDAVIANMNGNAETVWVNDGNGNLSPHPTDADFGGSNSPDVALGDVDGDGDLDAVVINHNEQPNTVWLNDGNGVFSMHATILPGMYGIDGELGDLDGDGDLDLMIADLGGWGHRVWMNDGTGSFSTHPTTPIFGGPVISWDLALGDLDGDGDLDAIVANDNGAAETVWLNNVVTVSPLSVATTEAGGTDTFTVVLDAQPAANVSIDLQSSNANEGRISTDGITQTPFTTLTFTNANWSTPQTVTVHGRNDQSDDGPVAYTIVTSAMTSTDLSFDGSDPPDVSATNSDDDVSGVTRTPGSVTVSESGTTANFTVVLDTRPNGIVVIDVASLDTGEATVSPAQLTFHIMNWSIPQPVTVTGVDDAVIDGEQLTTVILTMNGAATTDPLYDPIDPADVTATTADNDFKVVTTLPAANAQAVPRSAHVIANASAPVQPASVTQATFRVYGDRTGRLPGAYTATGTTLFAFNPTNDLKAGETIWATATGGVQSMSGVSLVPHVWQLTAATAPSTGVMLSHGGFGAGNSVAIALGDLDGDTHLDAIVGNYTSQAETVWLGDGSGTFTLETSFGDGDTQDVALGDLDGDGDLDAVVANYLQAETVWLNDGTGSFTQHATSPSMDWTTDVTLGDLDGDGDLDLVVTSQGAPHVVWLNDGSGGFALHPITPTFGGTGNGNAIALGDLDGDGDLDAVVANQNAGEQVWVNDGGGSFTQLGSAFGTGASWDVALGDLDGDGDLDAVVANGPGAETVWLNGGSGTFTPHGSIADFGDGNSRAVALGDLDGDGDLDAVVANISGAAETLWLNDGTGGFSEHPTHDSFGTGDSYGLALGDVDGDGDLDAFVANAGVEAESVWLNRDPPGITVIPEVLASTSESGAANSFSVVLDSQPIDDVSIQVDTLDASEARLSIDAGPEQSSITIVFTTANWSSPKTIMVHGQDDDLDDGDVAFTIATAAAVSSDPLYSGFDPGDVACTNVDDDTAGVTRTPASVSVSETGTDDDFTVVLDSQPAGDVVIDVTPTDSGEAGVSPPQLTFTPSDWSTPKNVTVTGVDDAIDDGDQVTSIALTMNTGATLDPIYDAIDPADVTVTTADDEEMHITATNPVANENSASRTANVQAIANATVDAATVTQSTFRIQGEKTGRLTGTYSASAGTFQLDPAGNLEPGELIRVTATSGIESTTDIALTPRVWQFTAAAGSGTGAMIAHPATPTFGGGETWDLALGDVDGDGDLDAIIGNQLGSLETVWRNDGNGNFTMYSSFDAGFVNSVALGDIDADGDLDALISGSEATAVMLNDGTGNFSPHLTTPELDGTSQGVALGDLDADGDLDAVAAVFSGPETVWLNDGTGDFAPHSTPSFGGHDSHGITLGDLDADGDLDAVVVNGGDNAHPETVWLNDGGGVFSPHPTMPSVGAGFSFRGLLGDLDGDGDLDLVVINDASLETVWLNDGTGSFSVHPATPTFGPSLTLGGALGDLDGDGDLDVVTADQGGVEEVWVNDGSGSLSAHLTNPSFGGGQAAAVALGDLDGDGDLDAMAGIYGGAETVWLNRNPVGITVTPADATVNEGGSTDTFTVVLDDEPVGDVVIDVASLDTGEATVWPAQLTFTTGNWSNAQVVTVTGVDDALDDGDQLTTITVSVNTAATMDPLYDLIDPNDVIATTHDNDVSPPANFSATATSTSDIAVSWTAVPGATAYQVWRSTSINTVYTLVNTTSNTFHNDNGRTANTTYLYKVRTLGPADPSAYTPVDAATTIVFTDPALNTSTKVKRLHVIELRTAVNAMRTAAELGAATFTDPTITAGATKAKRLHVVELRTALDAARAAIGLSALSYTDPAITVNSTKVKAAHIGEVRAGTQ